MVKKLLGVVLILLFNQLSAAAPSCRQLVGSIENPWVRTSAARKMVDQLNGRGDINFTISIAHPQFNLKFEHKNLAPKLTVKAEFSYENFYQEAYSHYSEVFKADFIKKLSQADASLEVLRLHTAEVNFSDRRQGDSSVATIRLYNGTLNSVVAGKSLTQSRLPFERLNSLRQVKRLKIQDQIDQMRNKGIKVFEVGKFSINSHLPAEPRARARKAVEAFWLQVVAANPDAVYVCQTGTKAHTRLYSQRYGMKIVETYNVKETADPEYIMMIPGHELMQRLSELVNKAE